MYAIELTIANRTYHYGSLAAYRAHVETLLDRAMRIAVATYKDGTSAQRKAELANMLKAVQAEQKALDEAMAEENRKAYA